MGGKNLKHVAVIKNKPVCLEDIFEQMELMVKFKDTIIEALETRSKVKEHEWHEFFSDADEMEVPDTYVDVLCRNGADMFVACWTGEIWVLSYPHRERVFVDEWRYI